MATNNKENFIISNMEELFCAIDTNFDDFELIFDQVIGQVIKNQQYLNSFLTYINIQLSNASTRGKGLILLNSLIKLCPTEILTEHSIQWINNALKPCQNEKQVNVTSFRVIGSLLEFCSKIPDLNKTVISNILEKVIDAVKTLPNDSKLANVGLDCLLICLRTFPGSCGPRKIPLNKYLTSFLYLPINHPNIRKAGKCLASLQQVGGGGVEGINYYNNWKKQEISLVATIHKLFDQFFEYVTEFGDYTQDISNVAPLEIICQAESKNYNKIAEKIINTIVFLEEMILGAFPVKKPFLPGIILNVITRGLTITSANLGPQILEESLNLSTNLSLIHKNLLQLLQCLILGLGTNLLPLGQNISKLIVNYLKNTKSEEIFVVKTFCDLKLVVYETLRLWLSVARSNSSLNPFLDGVLPILITDITPPKTELNLTVQNGSLKNMNKKARKKLMEQRSNNFANRNQNSMGKNLMSDSNYQRDMCASALKTIQLILNFEGPHMKIIYQKQLQDFVIRTLYNIQRGEISYPYTNENCQIELYRTLIKLNTSLTTPPLNYTIILLTAGQNDTSQKISETCSNGISIISSLVHPLAPTLQLPLDLEDLKNHLKEDKKSQNLFNELDNIFEIETETIENDSKNEKQKENPEIQKDSTEKFVDSKENRNLEKNNPTEVENSDSQDKIDLTSEKSNDSFIMVENGSKGSEIQINSSTNVENLVRNENQNENVVEIESDSNCSDIITEVKKSTEEPESKKQKFNEEEEEEMESLIIEDAPDEEKDEDIEDICSTFVDIVNE